MPNLLSGSLLRRGGSGEFIDLAGAMPQLPPTPTTSTGYSLVTDSLLRTSYRSSLGNIEFNNAAMWSNLATSGTIIVLATGTNIRSTGTNTGLLVVQGDIGVGGAMNIQKDITVNGITIGKGFEGLNNIVIKGTASPQVDTFENGQETIAIGYGTLGGITTSYKNIGIGRFTLQSGTNISNNIGIGDSALRLVGTSSTVNDSNIGIGVDAGKSLTAGQYNLFLGHEAARAWTTGSYNIILGQDDRIGAINSGSGIISIGGTELVDGKDNQVNIGSVFYYDGIGYAYIAADTSVGLGTDSTGTSSGALIVAGGVGIAGKVYSGECGNPQEGNLLYTPQIFTTATVPLVSRIGDIWIDPTIPAYLQYIKDGTSTFWIQVGAV